MGHGDVADDAVFEEGPGADLGLRRLRQLDVVWSTLLTPVVCSVGVVVAPSIEKRLTPLVQSTTPPAITKSLGFTSSLRLPTALNPTAAVTPSFFRHATFARLLISCGAYWWCKPCRARKATTVGLACAAEAAAVEGGV